MITEDRVCFNGVHTRRLSVSGNGTPIALLHGFADSADTWRGSMAEFEATGARRKVGRERRVRTKQRRTP